MRELVHVKITAKMTANRVPIWYVMGWLRSVGSIKL